MNPVLLAAGALLLVFLLRGRSSGSRTVDMVEVTPYVDTETGEAGAGDRWFIPRDTPRTDLHQPIPYKDGTPEGWALYELGNSWTRYYTRAADGLYYRAGDFEPRAVLYVRDVRRDDPDGPAKSTQDKFPWEHPDWQN